MIDVSPPPVANITRDRSESKFQVPRTRVSALVHTLSEHLAQHRFTGEGANRLPQADHYVTTVYFDTPSRLHFQSAQANPNSNIKLRAREYYDLHPGLVELATSPEAIVRYQPWVWFEIKRREGGRTLKERCRVRKQAVPGLFANGYLDPIQLAPEDSAAALRAIINYCQELPEPLAASCLVNYRRVSWQSADESLRVTLDLGLSFFAPPPDLWTRHKPLVRGELGPPLEVAPYAVVELKERSPAPSWLLNALESAEARSTARGKFVQAAAAVERHG